MKTLVKEKHSTFMHLTRETIKLGPTSKERLAPSSQAPRASHKVFKPNAQ